MATTYIEIPVSDGGGSAYWEDAAASFATLPVGDFDGQVRMTLDSHQLYYWSAGSVAWVLVPTGAIDPADIADTNSIDLTVTAGVLSADIKLSSNAAAAGNTIVGLNVESTSVVGLRAQVANSAIRALISSANTSIDYNNSTGVLTFTPGNVLHNDLGGLTSGDPHTQYAFLAGRATGQTFTGGTAASDGLTLRSTANATKGIITLQDVTQLPRRTTVEIAAVVSPVGGMIAYDTTLDRPKVYIAGSTNAWVDIVGWGAP